jgi:DNA invertase Pin-like site-specific DNA recombinase
MKNDESRIITNNDVADKTRLAYVRCSTIEQNESRQLAQMQNLGIYKIFVEKASAKDTKRPMLQQLLEYCREGDCIYITDFSRLARNVKDLLTIVENLEKRGIRLISLSEGLDTQTSTGKLMLSVIAAINQFLRENMLEKQKEGILIAKQEKKYKGRKKIEKPANWTEVYQQYMSRQIKAKQAMELTGLRRNTFFSFVTAESKVLV